MLNEEIKKKRIQLKKEKEKTRGYQVSLPNPRLES
jgi:hypothetical protein